METRFWFSKNLRLIVRKNESAEGKPFEVTNLDGTPFKNAGLLIKSCPNFWEHCLTKEQFDTKVSAAEFSRTPEHKEIKCSRAAERRKIQHEEAAAELAKLQEGGRAIPVTYENIAIVLRYLNSQNWGTWDLPAMETGYTANQYDMGSDNTATTILLDEPIELDGEMCAKFVYGATPGHLMEYRRVR